MLPPYLSSDDIFFIFNIKSPHFDNKVKCGGFYFCGSVLPLFKESDYIECSRITIIISLMLVILIPNKK